MTFDVICIGDTVLDTFIPLDEAKIIEIDGVIYLGLPFGAKIPVGESSTFVGGNAANSVVALSRLKLKTAIYTNIGKKDDDETDERIVEKFKKEGVDLRYVNFTDKFPANHNIVLNFKGERSILTNHNKWNYNLPDLDPAKWIYLTSMSEGFINSNFYDQLLNFIQRTGTRLFYQPGTFQLSLGLKKNARILQLTEVLILNLEESKKLLGYSEKEKIEIKKLLKKLSEQGPRKVIITDGKNGSYSFDGEKYLKLGIFPSDLIQKTGAGDAYSSGVLAGLINGEYLGDAMRWGAANSSGVVSKMGPQTGLLTLSKLKEVLKENKTILPKEF